MSLLHPILPHDTHTPSIYTPTRFFLCAPPQLLADRTLQRLKREYSDPASRANSTRLAEGLNDIQNIMRRNIQEVLDRGEKLESACEA